MFFLGVPGGKKRFEFMLRVHATSIKMYRGKYKINEKKKNMMSQCLYRNHHHVPLAANFTCNWSMNKTLMGVHAGFVGVSLALSAGGTYPLVVIELIE